MEKRRGGLTPAVIALNAFLAGCTLPQGGVQLVGEGKTYTQELERTSEDSLRADLRRLNCVITLSQKKITITSLESGGIDLLAGAHLGEFGYGNCVKIRLPDNTIAVLTAAHVLGKDSLLPPGYSRTYAPHERDLVLVKKDRGFEDENTVSFDAAATDKKLIGKKLFGVLFDPDSRALYGGGAFKSFEGLTFPASELNLRGQTKFLAENIKHSLAMYIPYEDAQFFYNQKTDTLESPVQGTSGGALFYKDQYEKLKLGAIIWAVTEHTLPQGEKVGVIFFFGPDEIKKVLTQK